MGLTHQRMMRIQNAVFMMKVLKDQTLTHSEKKRKDLLQNIKNTHKRILTIIGLKTKKD